MANIFVPTPSIKPSDLASIAHELMAFEKPVIGTRVPAPACFASFSYQPGPVHTELKATSIMEVHVPASVRSRPYA